MSRGGRGGFASGAGRMGGKELPFKVDADLEDQVLAYQEELGDEDHEWMKTLYPPMNVFHAPPPTAREKRLVGFMRAHRTAERNGPFFMDSVTAGKRDLAEFNAFEDVATYSNKRAKQTGGLPNLKKLPIVKSLLPRELWDLVDDDEDNENGEAGKAPKKNLNFLKKKRLDKLARFDDDDDTAAADKDDDDVPNEEEDGGEDDIEELRDDDFSEDDDDLGNDYNAEKYFDDGDGADDDGDGGDGGGEDAWQDEARKEKEVDYVQRMNESKAESDKITKSKRLGYAQDPFCSMQRAEKVADYQMQRIRQLNGELAMKVGGGSNQETHFNKRSNTAIPLAATPIAFGGKGFKGMLELGRKARTAESAEESFGRLSVDSGPPLYHYASCMKDRE